MTSNSSTPTDGGTGNSYSHRSNLSSPWAQVVRGGGEPDSAVRPRSPLEQNLAVSDPVTVIDPAAAVVESHQEDSESSNTDNVSGVKMSVWNKPSANGDVEGSNTPVMGAASWPALSELTRIPKSLSFPSGSSSKSISDGSVTVSQAPVISQSPQKSVNNNASHHSNQNHTQPVRQRSSKRGGGGNNRPPPPPPTPMPPYPLFDMPYGGFVPAVLDTAVREQSPYNGNSFSPRPIGGVVCHSQSMLDRSSNRKRNNFGSRPRGDGGQYLNNGLGGRRDHHDRDWHGPRSHQGAPPPPPPPRGYMQQAHLGPAPFIAPQPIRPYGAPMGYEMAPPPPPPLPFVYVPTLPPESFRGAPLFPRPPPPSTFLPPLSVSILRQIEYYFSDANLVKDNYLRSNMDEEGWVPVTLIAGFRRVQILTSDIQMILSSLRESTVVEIQGETVRRRNDWRKWLKPPTDFLTDSNFQLQHTATDASAIETSLHKFMMDELTPVENSTTDDADDTHNKEEASEIYYVALTDSLKIANGEMTTGDEFMNLKSSMS